MFALQVSGGGSTSSVGHGEGEAGTLIDLDQHFGPFRDCLGFVKLIILMNKAVKMSLFYMY